MARSFEQLAEILYPGQGTPQAAAPTAEASPDPQLPEEDSVDVDRAEQQQEKPGLADSPDPRVRQAELRRRRELDTVVEEEPYGT